MVEDPIQRRSASTGVLFEGHAIDEILQWPDADLQALLLHGEPVVFKAGSACVLGSFAVRDDTLVMELGQIDGGGEGVLTGLAALAGRYAARAGLACVEWRVHAVHCAAPNLKLRRVLERRGFVVRQIAGVGECYWLRAAVPAAADGDRLQAGSYGETGP